MSWRLRPEHLPVVPDAWTGERLRLVAGGRVVSTSENRAGERRAMTTLVADDPRTGQEIVLADDMEFASWDDAFDQVQVKLCSDPICGMEGCAPGSWVTARLIDDGTTVELGLSRHFESEDEDVEPDDVEDYWPPRWMQERGPVRVPRGDWERIAHEAAFEVQTAPAE